MTKNKILAMLLCLCLSLFNCNLNTSNTWKNEDIPNPHKTQITELNKMLIKNLKNDNISEIEKTFGKVMLEHESSATFGDVLSDFSKSVKNDSYNLIDEFYTENISTQASNYLFGDQYKFGYVAYNKKICVSILEIEATYNSHYLLGVIYGNYDGQWKINALQIGQYKLDGKNAVDFYELAKKQHDKNHIVDAANNLFLADKLLKPLADYWTYNQHEEILTLYKSVFDSFSKNYTFPMELEEIYSKPQLISISPKIYVEGIVPIINYKSNLDLQDSIRLRKEYLKVHKVINDRFDGLDEENNALIYKAWAAIPDGKTEIVNYTFIHKIEIDK